MIRILAPGQHAAACSHRAVSYLADGRQVVWEPPQAHGRIACDAELAEQRPPEALARRFAPRATAQEFNAAWTRAEAAAKLEGTPILSRLREHGLWAPSGIRTVLVDDVVVSYGSAP